MSIVKVAMKNKTNVKVIVLDAAKGYIWKDKTATNRICFEQF